MPQGIEHDGMEILRLVAVVGDTHAECNEELCKANA
jgi:hypothetical protein